MAKKKFQIQGARALRNEAYLLYAGMTKNETEHRSWNFYEAIWKEEAEMNIGKYIEFQNVRKKIGGQSLRSLLMFVRLNLSRLF